MLTAALEYHRRGLCVVPAFSVKDNGACECPKGIECDSPGKHPRVKWRQYEEQRPTDMEVGTWWTRWPRSNIAIVTGAISGLVVMDVDTRHGGEESYRDIAGGLPETARVITGSGGFHEYYRHPGRETPNAAGLMPGIDLRGDGGYVIAPPSNHVSGGVYEWEIGHGLEEIELADFPAAVGALMDGSRRKPGDPGTPSSRRFDLTAILSGDIAEGARNDTLTRIAGHYAAQGLTFDTLLLTLLGVNATRCRPPLPEEDVVKIATSIHEREERKRLVADAVHERLEEAASATNGHGASADIPLRDQREMARQLWAELGISGVHDWYVLRGDTTEYVLATTGEEIRLGDDLLDQRKLRKLLLNDAGQLLAPVESKQWNKRAVLLRQLARDETVEPTVASERLQEWLESFLASRPPQSDVEVEARGDALRSGAIVLDGRVHFRYQRFRQHVEMDIGERVDNRMIRRLLKRAGWSGTVIRAGASTVRTYVQPDGWTWSD